MFSRSPQAQSVLFVCVENSCRSQMAEALARLDGGDELVAASAGSRPSGVVNPDAVRAMAELDYDLSTHTSKAPDALPARTWDAVVTMGCGDACPTVPAARREDWPIPDPKGGGLEAFRTVRDDLRRRIRALLLSLRTEPVQSPPHSDPP